MLTWCQNEANIDDKTDQTSMPKLVAQKIMNIIKNHVSLNGKIVRSFKFYLKKNGV